MPLDVFERGPAQHHAHVDQHIVAHFSSLADHDAHAVVDDHPAADNGTGMDLDPREEAADVGDEPGPELEVMGPEPVRPAVEPEGMEPRVAEEDLGRRACSRVLRKNGPDIFPEAIEHHGSLSYQ